jgi:isopenicillin N synthase-like dioxygenase
MTTLDLSRYDAGGADRSRFLDELREAVGGVGAFSLVGHGIDPLEADAVLALSRLFFTLPHAELLDIEMRHSPHFRGYTLTGMERTQDRVDWREQLDVARESPTRPWRPDGKPYWGLHGPNQWPASLPELRPLITSWMQRLEGVARRLLHAISESIGLAPNHFDAAFSPDPHVHLKIVRYPGRTPADDDQGVGAHKDYGFVTVVLQDGVRGLQFADRSGNFIDLDPQRGAFAVNLGEMLEVATGGAVHATIHRVLSPPAGVERISLPFFYNPRLDYIVEPVTPARLNDLGASAAAGQATSVAAGRSANAAQGFDGPNQLFAEYGYNALKGWLRAHPHVAQLHYPELSGRDLTELALKA